jgi:hypothetical protein
MAVELCVVCGQDAFYGNGYKDFFIRRPEMVCLACVEANAHRHIEADTGKDLGWYYCDYEVEGWKKAYGEKNGF